MNERADKGRGDEVGRSEMGEKPHYHLVLCKNSRYARDITQLLKPGPMNSVSFFGPFGELIDRFTYLRYRGQISYGLKFTMKTWHFG